MLTVVRYTEQELRVQRMVEKWERRDEEKAEERLKFLIKKRSKKEERKTA